MKFFNHPKKISAKQLEDSFIVTQEVSLDSDEKESMLASLKLHMKENPLTVAPRPRAVPSPWQAYSLRVLTPVMGCFVLFLLAAGSVYAAQESIPGDILYPVKIHISENAEELFTIGIKAKAALQAKHALTRLQEAEQLARENRLDEGKKKDLTSAFKYKETQFREKLKLLALEGNTKEPEEMSADFNVSLTDHQTILQAIANARLDSNKEITEVAAVVRDILDGDTKKNETEVEAKYPKPVIRKPEFKVTQDSNPHSNQHTSEIEHPDNTLTITPPSDTAGGQAGTDVEIPVTSAPGVLPPVVNAVPSEINIPPVVPTVAVPPVTPSVSLPGLGL